MGARQKAQQRMEQRWKQQQHRKMIHLIWNDPEAVNKTNELCPAHMYSIPIVEVRANSPAIVITCFKVTTVRAGSRRFFDVSIDRYRWTASKALSSAQSHLNSQFTHIFPSVWLFDMRFVWTNYIAITISPCPRSRRTHLIYLEIHLLLFSWMRPFSSICFHRKPNARARARCNRGAHRAQEATMKRRKKN